VNLKRKVAVLISSHHPIFLEGMKMILGSDPHIKLVGETQHLWETSKKVRQLHPDVLLLDVPVEDPKAIAAIRHTKEASRKARILALSISGILKPTGSYKKAGVSMFIQPDTKVKELFQMIHAPAKAARKQSRNATAGASRRGLAKVRKSPITTFRLKRRATA
jgi:DNA-binding NarL/FixJ family response regulator